MGGASLAVGQPAVQRSECTPGDGNAVARLYLEKQGDDWHERQIY